MRRVGRKKGRSREHERKRGIQEKGKVGRMKDDRKEGNKEGMKEKFKKDEGLKPERRNENGRRK